MESANTGNAGVPEAVLDAPPNCVDSVDSAKVRQDVENKRLKQQIASQAEEIEFLRWQLEEARETAKSRMSGRPAWDDSGEHRESREEEESLWAGAAARVVESDAQSQHGGVVLDQRQQPTGNTQPPECDKAQLQEPRCPLCEECEASVADSGPSSLATRSRLHVRSFFQYPESQASRVFPPFSIQSEFEKKALVLAQEVLYDYAYIHVPHAQLGLWPQGPLQVSFGKNELEEALNAFDGKPNTRSACRRAFTVIHDFAKGVIDLRNSASHHSTASLETIDKHIQLAQALAVAAGDEIRAFQLRGMRDQVLQIASDTHSMIVDRVQSGVAEEQGWPIHVQLTFKTISFNAAGEVVTGNYSKELKTAALAWQKRHGWPHRPTRIGSLDHGYQMRLDTMKSRMLPAKAPFDIEQDASDAGSIQSANLESQVSEVESNGQPGQARSEGDSDNKAFLLGWLRTQGVDGDRSDLGGVMLHTEDEDAGGVTVGLDFTQSSHSGSTGSLPQLMHASDSDGGGNDPELDDEADRCELENFFYELPGVHSYPKTESGASISDMEA